MKCTDISTEPPPISILSSIPNVQLLLGTNSNNSCHRIPLMYSDNCPDPSPPVFNLSIPDPTQKLIFCWLWARETFNSLNIIKKSVFPGNYLLQRDWELKFPLCNQESARWLRWQTGNRFKKYLGGGKNNFISPFYIFWREKIRSCLNFALSF